MTEKEIQILDNLAEAVKKMDEREREQFIAFAEGITFATEKKAG